MNLVTMNYEQSEQDKGKRIFELFEHWWLQFGGQEWYDNGGPDKTAAWIIWQAAFEIADNPMTKR